MNFESLWSLLSDLVCQKRDSLHLPHPYSPHTFPPKPNQPHPTPPREPTFILGWMSSVFRCTSTSTALITALFYPISWVSSQEYNSQKLLKFRTRGFFHCCFARCAERVAMKSSVAKHYVCKRTKQCGIIFPMAQSSVSSFFRCKNFELLLREYVQCFNSRQLSGEALA